MLAFSGEEAQHSSLLLARAVLLWLSRFMPFRRALRRRRPCSFVAHPWCDVPAAASNATPAPCGAVQARRRSLSLGRRRSTRACSARAPYRAGCGWSMRHGKTLRWREAFFLRSALVVRRASYAPPTPSKRSVPRSACAPALAVSGEEAELTSLLLRSRRAALVAAVACALKGHCAGKWPLSVGTRWWCDVHAVIPNAKPALRVTRHRRAGARCH